MSWHPGASEVYQPRAVVSAEACCFAADVNLDQGTIDPIARHKCFYSNLPGHATDVGRRRFELEGFLASREFSPVMHNTSCGLWMTIDVGRLRDDNVRAQVIAEGESL